ncbi:MAG: phosphotransferase family protein [Myxococcales bacterium]|nr:phosphotransferase family protein [Myxococcales bacterium]
MDELLLKERIAAHLAQQTGTVWDIEEVKPLPGGACQDNLLVVAVENGFPAMRLVLRSDAPRPLQGSLKREQELNVITAAVSAGVKTPPARWFGADLVRNTAGGYFMDWVEGTAIGRKVVTSAQLAGARMRLAAELAEQLVRIHSILPTTYPQLISSLGAPPDDPTEAVLRQLQKSVETFVEPHPALDLAIRWLWDHKPAVESVNLVHGDFRVGNFMVSPVGLVAVVDWEFAHWGSIYEDLGWISVRDWRFGQNKLPVGGFSDRETFLSAYERYSGRTINRRTVRFWEAVGNVRWAVGCVQQGERYLSGEQQDIELLAISLRTSEMEYEALRLIERMEECVDAEKT